MAEGTAVQKIALFLILASHLSGAELRAYLRRGDPRALQIARSIQPASGPFRIHQTVAEPGGYLWLATEQGLYRFDGSNFHRIVPSAVTGVARTTDHSIVAAGRNGLLVVQRAVSRKLHDTHCEHVAVRGNEIVATCGAKLMAGSASHLIEVASPTVHGPLALDRSDSVWFGCGFGACEFNKEGKLRVYGEADGVPRDQWPGAIRDDVANLWLWDTHRVVRIKGGQSAVVDQYPPTVPGEGVFHAVRTRQGAIRMDGHRWIDEAGRFHVASWPTSIDLLRQNYAEDHLGQLWMTSTGGGVSLLSPATWLTGWQLHVDVIGEPSVVSHSPRQGALAATTHGLTRLDPTSDRWLPLPGAYSSDEVLSFAEARRGGHWVLFRNRGIHRVDGQGRSQETVAWAGMTGTEYRTFHRDRLGALWLGAKKELYRLDEKAGSLEAWPLPVNAGSPVAFARSPSGEDWLGYEGGIARRNVQGWELVVPSSALFSSRVRQIAVAAGPSFWVCYRTTGPVSRVYFEGGQWRRRDYWPEGALDSSNIWTLLRDRRGWIWIGTEKGLVVNDGVHQEPRDWIRLTESHNLPSGELGQFGLSEDEDGVIWAATKRGPARIEPSLAWFATKAEVPRVTRVRWRGTDDYWPATAARLEGPGALEIDFARWPGVSPKAAGIEYRLNPREQSWRFASAGSVRYDDLPVGEYRFEMRPAEGGPTQEFSILVQPAGAQFSWQLLALGAVAPVGASYLLWRRRRRKIVSDYWQAKQAFLRKAQGSDGGSSLATGDTIAQKYRTEQILGQGGFSSVYLATDLTSGRQVALKILHTQTELPGWQRKRFLDETRALALIQHPGIVELLDSGLLHDNTPFLVMRYVTGPSLRQVLRSGLVERERVARWVVQLGEALATAHGQGVVHRDLKPENIIIEGYGTEAERLVVVDFGAASTQTGETANGSTVMLVSRDYTAPERVQGRSSAATDTYGLAAIAFELLSGVRYASVEDNSPAGLRLSLAGFPDTVAELIASGTAFDPANRPADILDYARRLAAALRA